MLHRSSSQNTITSAPFGGALSFVEANPLACLLMLGIAVCYHLLRIFFIRRRSTLQLLSDTVNRLRIYIVHCAQRSACGCISDIERSIAICHAIPRTPCHGLAESAGPSVPQVLATHQGSFSGRSSMTSGRSASSARENYRLTVLAAYGVNKLTFRC